MPAKDITLYYNAVCKEHSYDNGFCTKCGGYQPADYNESTGNYEIGNGGQMFWFAALVNGDGEHTLIQEAKPDAHGVLVSDISLKNPSDENYEWKPIGEFKGIFDGQNHTISDFSMTKVNDQSIGFFQNLMSDPNETDEAKKATLKNFTFDGQGYYVYRFDIKSSDGNAALFDTIGARGSVKNFGAFYQNIEGEKAAGLAIVNYGLIDECISGSNLSGSFTDQLTKEPKNLTETTIFVKGTSMAGGVVVENKGVIRNTANYAKATASASDGIVGGIAVVNSGTIENCMSIGTLSTKENGIAGGIVGKLDKNGSIQIAYSAQTAIEGGTTGAVFGAKEETAGAVNNTYYQDTLSGNEEQGTAKTAAEMKSNAFKEELNTLVAGNEELCSWTWNSTKNQGYPRILSSLITEVELVNASRGLTVKGIYKYGNEGEYKGADSKHW